MQSTTTQRLRNTPSFSSTLKNIPYAFITQFKDRSLANSWTRFMLYIEALPLWQKIAGGMLLPIPLLITGIALSLTPLIMLGAMGIIFSVTVISLVEYYNHRHKKEQKSREQLVSQVDDEINNLRTQLDSFSQEADHYQSNSVKAQKQLSQEVTQLTQQQKNLHSTITDLERSNEVLIQLNETLTSENQALHHVVTEKNRVVSQNEQTINKLEQALSISTQQQIHLQSELTQYKELELTLRTEIKLLTEHQDAQQHHLEHQTLKVQQLHDQLNKVVRQRRYLVSQVKEKTKVLELTFQQSTEEQQKLKLTIKHLELSQAQLQQRVKTINLNLFQHQIVHAKTKQLLDEALTTVQSMHKENELLTVQLESLTQQNELLTQHIASLLAVEQELLAAKEQMRQVISTLEEQIIIQGAVLTDTQQQLEQALKDYLSTRETLGATVNQLVLIKNEMSQEMEALKNTRNRFARIISTLSEAAIKDEKNKDDFLNHIKETMKQKEDSFAQLALGVGRFNEQLSVMSSEFNACIARHKHLLHVQEQHIQQLESQVTPFGLFHPKPQGTCSLTFHALSCAH